MSKGTRWIKRVMALSLVLLLSIESFGAIVSDNDGSAFITKAEFDSLKNDFQAQINSYNTSIDDKIDGAIAAYLSGINIAKEERKNIIFKDWDTGVTCLNYKPTVTWRLVDLDLSFTQSFYLYSGGWMQSGEATSSAKYEKPYKQVIYICDAGIDTKGKEVNYNNEPSKVLWKGRAYEYKDKLTVSQTYKLSSGYLSGGGNGSVRFNYWCNFGVGYYQDLSSSARNIWAPQDYWYHSNSSWRQYISLGSQQSKSAATSVKLEPGSNGKTVDYEHIITWGTNFSTIYVADPSWLGHLTKNPTYDASNYPSSNSNGLTLAGSYFVVEANETSANSGTRGSGNTTAYKGDNTNSVSYSVPVIGLLNKTYKYDTLYQYGDVIKADTGKEEIKSDAIPVLSDGFPLLAAKKGEVITWQPVFKNSKKGTSTVTDNIYLRLCVNEFGTTDNLKSSKSVRCKDLDNKDSSGNNNEYFIIKDNSGTIRWEMPKDGIVYAKWRHETIGTGNWEITLDIPNCNTYKRKEAE